MSTSAAEAAQEPLTFLSDLLSARSLGQVDLATKSAQALPACCAQDKDRYLAGVKKRKLWFVLDRFGQVAVLDEKEQVVAMFIAFRDRFAAWLPDGTTVGSLTLSLAVATPNATSRIGHALTRHG